MNDEHDQDLIKDISQLPFMPAFKKETAHANRDREALEKLLTEEIGGYGVQCSETKELAPPKSLTDTLAAIAAILHQADYWENEAKRYAANADFWRERSVAALTAQGGEPLMIAAVDAAMHEAENLHPQLRRSDCERLIKAALGVHPLLPFAQGGEQTAWMIETSLPPTDGTPAWFTGKLNPLPNDYRLFAEFTKDPNLGFRYKTQAEARNALDEMLLLRPRVLLGADNYRITEHVWQTADTQHDRDMAWILAMGHALGADSGFSVPIVPKAEPFRKLFAEIKERQTAGTVSVPGGVAKFAAAVCEEARDHLGDIDGGWLQDEMEACGLLSPHEVTEPCDSGDCRCEEYGLPTTCYRYTPAAESMFAAAKEGK